VAAAADDGATLSRDEICICASHTHSAPPPYDPHSADPATAQFGALVADAMVSAMQRAIADERPALVRSGVGDLDRMWNRRMRDAGEAVDRRVPVFAAQDAVTGRVRIVVFGLGCHPVTMGWDSNEVSADFPGRAKRRVEERLGVEHALFFNTTEGDVVPSSNPRRDALDPRGYCGTGGREMAELGDALGDEVVAVVERAAAVELSRLWSARLDLALAPNYAGMTAVEADELRSRSAATLRTFLGDDLEQRVPATHLWSAASEVVVDRDLPDDEMRALMVAVCGYLVGVGVRARSGAVDAAVPAQVIRLHDLDLLALPGEALVDVGRRWSTRSGSGRAFVVGLANGHLRYLPTAAHFAEPEAAERYETITAGLGTSGVDAIVDEASRLLASTATS
jgi:hypothetical protein